MALEWARPATFLLALFAILGILSVSLTPFFWFMTIQYLITLLAHHYYLKVWSSHYK